MNAIKDFEKDGKGCIARLAYGGYSFLFSVVNGIFCIPWIICYYKFIYDLEWRDPYHCWVVEGDYRAYAEAPGIDGEADIGAEFNEWVMFNWYIVLVAVAAPFATAIFACGFPYCIPCGAIISPCLYWLRHLQNYSLLVGCYHQVQGDWFHCLW